MKKKRLLIVIAILVVVAIVALFILPSSNQYPAPAFRTYITINPFRINFIDQGQGLPLIFIHGFGASNYCWRKNLDFISKYYRVLAPDLPGFGYSSKPLDADYSVEAYADFIIRFMEKLKIKKAVLVGHSLGGGIALSAALKYPNRVHGLVLIDAEAYPIEEPFMVRVSRMPVVKSLIHKAIGRYVIRISLKRSFYDQSLVTPSLVDQYYAPFLTENGKSAPIKVLQTLDFNELRAISKQYNRIKKKTLIIWGKEDQISGIHLAHKLKKDIRGSRRLIIPQSGHLVQEEKSETVNRAIIKFIRRGWRE